MYSSCEEVDQPDDHLGTGRSYECVFCRRGFTTAQALGGHMNIHRKDRAKKKLPPKTNNTLIDSKKINGHFHQPILSYPPSTLSKFDHYGDAQIRYQSYFPASSTSSVGPNYICSPRNIIGDDDDKWRMMSSTTRTVQFEIKRSHQIHVEDEEEIENGGNEGDHGLDLELRLGWKR